MGRVSDAKDRLMSAVRELIWTGSQAPDAAAKARMLHANHQSLLTGARIANNLEILREAMKGTWEVLGIEDSEPVPA